MLTMAHVPCHVASLRYLHFFFFFFSHKLSCVFFFFLNKMFLFFCPMTFVFLPNQCGVFAGLSHTPRSDKSEISFKKSDPSSYRKYVQSMNEFLELYNETKQTGDSYEECGSKYHTMQSAFTICHSWVDVWRSKLKFCFLTCGIFSAS